MSLSIRTLNPSDLVKADQFRQFAGWNQTPRFWHHLIRWNPEGCFLALWEGTPAGTATVIPYDRKFAWIGMVLVHPDHRNQGIGTELLRRCLSFVDERRIPCARLDATPEGKPIYENLGFREEWTLTRWKGTPSVSPTPDCFKTWSELNPEAISPLDHRAFGALRPLQLDDLSRDSTKTVVSVATNHQVLGFGMLRPGSQARYLGPLVADSADQGIAIATHLLATPGTQPVLWDIPDPNQPATQLATRLNFAPERSLTRMIRGHTECFGDPLLQFAIADPAIG